MTNRILDVSKEGTSLSIRHEQLVIRQRGQDKEKTVPLEDIAILVVSNAQTTYTHPVLTGLSKHGAGLIVCDDKHQPSGMCLPLGGHSLQAERAAIQAGASQPAKKQLWKQIVCAKIREQSTLLKKLHNRDYGLDRLQKEVRSGDSDNREARAAKIYWRHLFGRPFHRNRYGEPPNNLLNYGYAVLRAIISRGICGAGLYPALGIFHHNRQNSFCLADDLMEPFRPIVDRAAETIVKSFGQAPPELTPETKGELIRPLLERYRFKGEFRTLFDLATISANSLIDVFQGRQKKLLLPMFLEREEGV
ncbi:type II CRISPR-associated endonuclease Cas1 [Kiritimatiella glycovorans]|uniref:CRISPR-associated endonuclease Cas1 n=1 Tax=Kiritimatiella glycovorans TaxID=1307763 RepID=A0A0G3EM46_9BACT|nr:type II CRISPR-associated endonuclease Cas1 [Kiritimatiella glycovorans]AKJ65239.1 CRISPR-associated endonuclease Cas1 [Kiritimatiella glycovorans]